MKSEWDDLDHLKRNLERAFTDIYRQYQRKLMHWLRLAWSALRLEDREDIFQDSVISTWENIDSGRLNALTNLYSYIRGIADNLAHAFWRKQKRIHYFDDMFQFLAAIDPDAELEKLTAEQLAQIWAHIDQMNDPNRSILTLTFKYGMSSMEIAEVMHYSTENQAAGVRQQRKRALDQLKKLLPIQKIASS